MSRKLAPLTIPATMGVTRGDLVTTGERLQGEGDDRPQRKIYLVLGLSRNRSRVRACTWSHAQRMWSQVHTWDPALFVAAPEDWPQTKAARRWLQENRLPW